MKRWWLVIVLLLSLGVNLGILSAMAISRLAPDESRPSSGRFPQAVGDTRDLARRVGLAKEETHAFRALHQRFFERTRQQRRASMELRQHLLAELTADEPNRQRIDDILARLSAAEAEMERAMVETTLQSRELLDSEQETRYLRFLVSRLHRIGGRPGMGGPGGPGGPGGRRH